MHNKYNELEINYNENIQQIKELNDKINEYENNIKSLEQQLKI